ncbi:MAG TPA: ubiquinone/menaquinone biosynthesis methyltransferase [Gemmatimonadales bacterium]|nr:ubiquinone/menaquinone biosynthesis methyltransferase [Gemmatimonadales bacterium]
MTLAPPAPSAPSDKRRYVREMFSAIAPRYDLLNHLLSLNVDRSWRRRAVDRLGWEARASGTYLDACAGTLDLAAELARRRGFRGRVVGADFAGPMLRLGSGKVGGGAVVPAAADTLALPFADGSFDGATVGFGVRNLDDLDAGLRELWRVLRPGARLVILDFTTPPRWPMRTLYLFYFRRVLPLVGRAVSGHPTAYAYLPASVETFPAPAELLGRMAAAGFRDGGYELLTGGIAAIHWGAR